MAQAVVQVMHGLSLRLSVPRVFQGCRGSPTTEGTQEEEQWLPPWNNCLEWLSMWRPKAQLRVKWYTYKSGSWIWTFFKILIRRISFTSYFMNVNRFPNQHFSAFCNLISKQIYLWQWFTFKIYHAACNYSSYSFDLVHLYLASFLLSILITHREVTKQPAVYFLTQ